MQTVTFNTNGLGYWSRAVKAVEIVDMQVAYINDERDFGELRVYFNTDTWDVNTDGQFTQTSNGATNCKRF